MRYLHFHYKYDINSTSFCDNKNSWELIEAENSDIRDLIRRKQELLNDFYQLSTLGVINKPGYFVLRCFALGYIVLREDEDWPNRHIVNIGIPMLQDNLSTRPNYFEVTHSFDIVREEYSGPTDPEYLKVLYSRIQHRFEADVDVCFKQHSSTVQSMKFFQRSILVGG